MYRCVTHIISNLSIGNSDFLFKSWSVGQVTHIPKEGNPLDAGNWLKIVILTLKSKLLERAVH